MKRIVVFASGSGSNTVAIINYFKEKLTAEVVAVFSNKQNAKVLEKAENLGVKTYVFGQNEVENGWLHREILSLKPDLIVLAGYLWKFPTDIITDFPNKIVNIHPALLPNYGGKGMYGIHVHTAVLANKDEYSGITVHFVNENYDEGATIFQAQVLVNDCKTPEEIAQKVLQLEHKHYPEVIEKLLV
ncbi:phosphoribosylglycinamide formyltransferase [Flavobacterium sp. NST-5]|uniref:phosphoribosylglycinamide formyltransferase 1 n=1 Tax=Flavobacterium ichthyis TaxID=2698827 RepID=A0ABW9Z9C3_9FLAO|nr:phosphoribosylglycinamide formyltransferase [Flavobacterium ichthyis]NBL64700.1 phosphoribosylglycinamide formyltransferase [Flavobacterium ichthyis]